jgi:hypothetical protein
MPRRASQPHDPDIRVEIRDFGGYVPNADPHDLPPGTAQAQVNAIVIRPGELRCRQGARVVLFD